MPNLPWSHRSLCQLTIVAASDMSMIVNTHHFEASTAQETAMINDQTAVDWSAEVVDYWIAQCKTSWLACHSTDYIMSMVKCQVLERPNQFRHKLTSVERPLTTANAGTVAFTTNAMQVAAVIKWRTPQAGKSSRGRTYVGPITENWMVNGTVAPTGVTAIKAYADKMIAEWGPSGVRATEERLTVYSRPYNQGEYQYTSRRTGTLQIVTPGDYAGNSTNITVSVVDTILRTQRRRELGVGA
jgi:hypothetical protein